MKKLLSIIGIFAMCGCVVNADTINDKPLVIVDTVEVEPNPSILIEEEVRETKHWEEKTTDNTIQITYQDAQILMRIAQTEAGNQGVQGMYLVMQTVWNRVQSPIYPDSVWEVVTQPCQFEPITNGTYYTVEITPEAHEALAMFEKNLDADKEIIAFESVHNNASLKRYYDTSFTYLGHTFYKQKD